MKATKYVICAVISVLVILSPIALLLSAVFLTPTVYSDTFVGALDEKMDRLNSIDGEKVVIIGGSSVAFGIDSALMEEHLGMPVVNLGLYAALGTRLMLDLSRSNINEGDIVVLAPELDAQTLSMYFSSEHTLEAFDDDYSMLGYVRGDNKLSLLGGLWKHGTKKLAALRDGAVFPEGVYNSRSFNEYCDVRDSLVDENGNTVFSRSENIMPLYYDPATVIDLSPRIVEPEFVDYLNEYIDFCHSRGATVYFSYPPMNRLALKEGLSDSDISAFTKYLERNINCEFISYIDSYIIEEGYFYDTNYHLNSAGVILRSKMLIEDILIALGRFTSVNITVPDAPALPEIDVKFSGEDENDKYFIYEKMENGALMITGLSELGLLESTLTVPLGAMGYKISAIGKGAFSGGVARTVIITEDTNVRNLLDGCFENTSVKDLYIYYDFTDESEKLAPASSFFGITIHVPRFSQYLTHYDWKDTSGGYTMVDDIE